MDDDSLVQSEMKLYTFMDTDMQFDMHSIERVREYLETEIGESKVVLIYPILLDIGD
jgi:hypothetical protein